MKVDVIKDNRDKKVYIDEPGGMIRMFETVLEKDIELKYAQEKYPNAITILKE